MAHLLLTAVLATFLTFGGSSEAAAVAGIFLLLNSILQSLLARTARDTNKKVTAVQGILERRKRQRRRRQKPVQRDQRTHPDRRGEHR